MKDICGNENMKSVHVHWEGDNDELKAKCLRKMQDKYGDQVPSEITDRLYEELALIRDNGFAGAYLTAYDFIHKGGVESYDFMLKGKELNSFVVYLLDMSGEINPLPPHYSCSKCHYIEMYKENNISFGIDLPEKICPVCGNKLNKEGFSLHHFMAMGPEGEKVPDFHFYLKKSDMERSIEWVRALRGIAAFIPITNGVEDMPEDDDNLIGYAVIPEQLADAPLGRKLIKEYSGKQMTGKEYFDKYLWLPKLGVMHSKYLETYSDYRDEMESGKDPLFVVHLTESVLKAVPSVDDIRESILNTTEDNDTLIKLRNIIEGCGVNRFSDFVKAFWLIDCNVAWAKDESRNFFNGELPIDNVICDRDDLFKLCSNHDIDMRAAYKIMEHVRKGKGLSENDAAIMREAGISQRQIDLCKKIDYLYPKSELILDSIMMWNTSKYRNLDYDIYEIWDLD